MSVHRKGDNWYTGRELQVDHEGRLAVGGLAAASASIPAWVFLTKTTLAAQPAFIASAVVGLVAFAIGYRYANELSLLLKVSIVVAILVAVWVELA